MILGIQIIGAIFGLIMSYLTFLNYKRKELGKLPLLFWQLIWLSFVLIVLFPTLTQGIVHQLGFARTMDFLTVLGFMFVFFLTLRNYFNHNKLKKKIEEQIRNEALKNL